VWYNLNRTESAIKLQSTLFIHSPNCWKVKCTSRLWQQVYNNIDVDMPCEYFLYCCVFVGLLLVSLFHTVVCILSVVFLGVNCNDEAYSLQYVRVHLWLRMLPSVWKFWVGHCSVVSRDHYCTGAGNKFGTRITSCQSGDVLFHCCSIIILIRTS